MKYKVLHRCYGIRMVFFLLVLPFAVTACGGLGASKVKGERSRYNIAIQGSNDEQLLLNLVRLKYRDTPFFLQVSSVASQFSRKFLTRDDFSSVSWSPEISQSAHTWAAASRRGPDRWALAPVDNPAGPNGLPLLWRR